MNFLIAPCKWFQKVSKKSLKSNFSHSQFSMRKNLQSTRVHTRVMSNVKKKEERKGGTDVSIPEVLMLFDSSLLPYPQRSCFSAFQSHIRNRNDSQQGGSSESFFSKWEKVINSLHLSLYFFSSIAFKRYFARSKSASKG